METIRRLSLTVLLSVGVFCILTIPHLTFIFWGFGYVYPNWLMMIVGLLSGIVIAPKLAKSKYFK